MTTPGTSPGWSPRRGQHHARGHAERGRRPRGIPDDSIHGTYAQSQAVLDDLAALGIDYADVVQILEDQGVTAFDASWDHLGQRLARALGPDGAGETGGRSDTMPASGTFVIAGGGLAGAKAAEALREQGFDGRIVLVAEEDVRPYERPPLSKDYLQGKTGARRSSCTPRTGTTPAASS